MRAFSWADNVDKCARREHRLAAAHILFNLRNAQETRMSGHSVLSPPLYAIAKINRRAMRRYSKVITVAVYPENAWHTCSVFQKNILTFNFVLLPCRRSLLSEVEPKYKSALMSTSISLPFSLSDVRGKRYQTLCKSERGRQQQNTV